MARMAAGGVVGGGPAAQSSVRPNTAAATAAGHKLKVRDDPASLGV